MRFKVFDPDCLFERLVPRLRFFFSRQFGWISLGLIALAVGVTITNWGEIHRSLIQLYRVETIALAWASFLGIVIGHEFAHGLTCKRFGGKVHEVGLLLIYLQPAMYCNVSDAWLFPEKSKRLLVTLAGACSKFFAGRWRSFFGEPPNREQCRIIWRWCWPRRSASKRFST